MIDDSKILIFLVSGEPSGDRLGADLVSAVRLRMPNCRFMGVGGPEMAQAGTDLLIDSSHWAVMGLWNGLWKLPTLWMGFRKIVRFLKKTPPHVLILIDYPGFNLRLAEQAKALGIRILHYVSPQIWIWHYHRIERIRRTVDHVAVLFPFEKEIYDREGIPATWVGHPVARAKPTASKKILCTQLGIHSKHATIALLPGSRVQEVHYLLPHMLEAARYMRTIIPELQCILITTPDLESYVRTYDLSHIVLVSKTQLCNVLQLCHAAVAASGTVTLELACFKIPMVVVYKVHPVSFWLSTWVKDLKPFCSGERSFALSNILLKKRIFPELLQDAVQAKAIAEALLYWIDHPNERYRVKKILHSLRTRLNHPQAEETLTHLVCSLCQSHEVAHEVAHEVDPRDTQSF